MAGYKFDYETKVWGGDKLRVSPVHFRASRLYYALKEMDRVYPLNNSKNRKIKLLDIGCGVGDFIESFEHYRPDLKITAIDISKKAITQAKKRKLKAKFIVSDAQKLPFKDNSFDIVTCFDLIEHVQYPKKVISEINRVCKSGGLFQTFIPTEAQMLSIQGPMIKLGWKAKEVYGGHPHHFTKREVVEWVESAGFRVDKIRWGEHFVNQILEILYFSYLSLRGKNAENTVEGYLSTANNNFAVSSLRIAKNILASLSYFETRALNKLPGLGVHMTCTKP